MIISHIYKTQNYTLTQAQKDVLFQKAREIKARGYSHMVVLVVRPPLSGQSLLEFVATDGEYSQRAFVGPRGGLTSGLGSASKRGVAFEKGNAIEGTQPTNATVL